MGGSHEKRSREPSEKRSHEIQLLLHCVDGCVPYLNPYQLELHFSPSDTNLWLGLAVKDSCVAPIFNLPSDSAKDRKEQKSLSESAKNKVRGYTFAANSPDPWLLPYTRVTVPSFGMKNTDRFDKETKNSTKWNPEGNTSRNTNDAVYVWTPHGRQKLTADLYATASFEGLKSQHTVSLFDFPNEEEVSKRRKLKAETRNQEWFEHLLSRHKSSFSNDLLKDSTSDVSGDSGSILWKPIVLPNNTNEDFGLNDESKKSSASSLKVSLNKGRNIEHVPSGIAFIGQLHPDVQLNEIIDKDITMKTRFDAIPWRSILSTYTLLEILDVASTGVVNVIGTNLPQKWASDKLALGLDLSIEDSGEKDSKRQKLDAMDTLISKENTLTTDKTLLNADGCLDLSRKVYTRDPRTLVVGCDCFVCKNDRFSRAYIHHLVVAKEMLAEILIFGHNLHCLLKLLRYFNSDESKRQEVKQLIHCQLPSTRVDYI